MNWVCYGGEDIRNRPKGPYWMEPAGVRCVLCRQSARDLTLTPEGFVCRKGCGHD